MRFKYYLRGIGLGILFAVLIMIISIHNHKYDILSDDEIIEKAKELGMVTTEQSTEQIKETESENSTELSFGDNVSTTEVYKVETDNDANSDNDTDKDSDTEAQDTQTSESNSNEDEADYVIIKVEKGDVCRNISIALQELNIIEDAEDLENIWVKKDMHRAYIRESLKSPKMQLMMK